MLVCLLHEAIFKISYQRVKDGAQYNNILNFITNHFIRYILVSSIISLSYKVGNFI